MGEADVMDANQITDWRPIDMLIDTQWGFIFYYKYCSKLMKDLGEGNDRTFIIRYDWIFYNEVKYHVKVRACAIYETTDMTKEQWENSDVLNRIDD